MRQRGYIFIQALLTITILVSLLAMMSADEHASMVALQTRVDQRRAEQAVDAAVARSMASLQNANSNEVTLNDDWAQQGGRATSTNGAATGGGDEQFQFQDGSATYRLQIVDAGSQLNVNSASNTQLSMLPLTQDQVDSLLDWIQTGQNARTDGAKDSYYNGLPTPYNTKLAPLDTLDELLLVKGWTAQTLYLPPTVTTQLTMPTDANGNSLPLASMLTVDSGAPNTQASGQAKINLGARTRNPGPLTQLGINQALAQQIVNATPITSFLRLSQVRGMNAAAMQTLLDAVTFTTATRSTGKIDLNTVTQPVLQTVPYTAPDIDSAIISQQAMGFQTLSALANVPGVTQTRLAELADSFTVGSDTWIVRAYGHSGLVGEAVEATVGIRNGEVQVTNWNRINTSTVPSWWGWSTQSGSTVDAGSSQ